MPAGLDIYTRCTTNYMMLGYNHRQQYGNRKSVLLSHPTLYGLSTSQPSDERTRAAFMTSLH